MERSISSSCITTYTGPTTWDYNGRGLLPEFSDEVSPAVLAETSPSRSTLLRRVGVHRSGVNTASGVQSGVNNGIQP